MQTSSIYYTHRNFIEDLFFHMLRGHTTQAQADAPASSHFLRPPLGVSSARVCNPCITFDTRVTGIAPLEPKDI